MPVNEPKKPSPLANLGCVAVCVLFAAAISLPPLLMWWGFPDGLYLGLFGRRSLPEDVSGLEWQGGTVYSFDASSHPGYLSTEVRWRGPDGLDVMLVQVGDVSSPEVLVRDGALRVRWRADREDRTQVVSPGAFRGLRSQARSYEDSD